MKKPALLSVFLFIAGFMIIPGLSLAGYGPGGNHDNHTKCPGDGSGPLHDICSGIPFDYDGTIVEMNGRGAGFALSTMDGMLVQLYGMGPTWYWKALGVDKPQVGDTIGVKGYTVDFGNGMEMNIATEVSIDDNTVKLRDDEDCTPLWKEIQRRMRNKINTGNWEN